MEFGLFGKSILEYVIPQSPAVLPAAVGSGRLVRTSTGSQHSQISQYASSEATATTSDLKPTEGFGFVSFVE